MMIKLKNDNLKNGGFPPNMNVTKRGPAAIRSADTARTKRIVFAAPEGHGHRGLAGLREGGAS
jgi:hypothetical protein